MKSITRLFILMATLSPVASLSPAVAAISPRGSAHAVAMRFAQAVIHIPGMTCSNHSCATAVYMSLIRLPGVMGVGVDESTQNVTVKYIPARTRPAVFLKAVKNAGFPGTLVRGKGA
ncbi:heavy-metal-associated domain-containing protein [Acidiferrobacter sp. SPIII_3]|jgi:copper chaperone CopZ|uniref:heavy-metal-associated domain-containing protein n=1 Tax=Acidiferrobacter sp. SPIII_3 TaxID=1281578 RepID=UPI00143DA880|nr:heavy-metal-associated domain-containing protein [Acidiferrobacter sp. SPIII_3]